jgi:REP element-mobilizing transposase RayT
MLKTLTKYTMTRKRKSIRLKGYDYTAVGRYFVTIVVRERWQLFGTIVNGKMVRNVFGEIAAQEWNNTTNLRDNVSLGAFIIMPDHVHFVVHIDEQRKQKQFNSAEIDRRAGVVQGKHINKPGSLGAIVRGYKGAVTRQVLTAVAVYKDVQDERMRHVCERLETQKTIWLRNYNESIIKSQRHYGNVTNYIKNNPNKWEKDLKKKLKIDNE